jgi:Transposase DDE domain group 1
MRRINKRQKINKNQGEIEVEFSAKNITSFGGLGLLRKLVGKLDLERVLDRINPSPADEIGPGGYTVGEKIMSLVYGLILDLERPADTAVLKRDKVFQSVIGYEAYPDQSVFSRFLGSFAASGAQEIGDQDSRMLLRVRHNFRDWSKLTLDMDSHVKTVYGNQQRAKVGYNPKKRGRKSYHPLFCFIGETRDFLLGKFRSGNKNSISGAVELLRDGLRIIPKHIIQLYLRADSGFFSFAYLSFLEKHWIKYAVVAKLYGPIQMQLGGLKYRDIGSGVEVSEFEYCLRKGKETLPCRMIVIREEIKEGKEAKKEAKLFELKGYSYQVIATNIRKGAPEDIWRFYNGRANIENMIKEATLGFGLDVSPSHKYAGNMAYFQIGMLAYNLVNWFKETALCQDQHKKMLKWVRNHFFLIAGKLVRTGGGLILKLSQSYPWQEEYRKAEDRLEALQFT